MSNKDTGGPAFPTKKRVYRAGYATNEFEPVGGMTLRDYFAAKANDADLIPYMWEKVKTGSVYITGEKQICSREQAKYRYADAMLEARKS